MPMGTDGNYHMNPQRARHAGPPREKAAKDGESQPKAGGMEHEDGSKHTTLHDHGDGSYHTETHDGQREEHPHIGHALMHMAGMHHPDGKHMHIHHDGMSMTSHHHEGGQTEGPHDHQNIEALKSHMDQFLNEEGNEWSGKDYEGGGKQEAMAGY